MTWPAVLLLFGFVVTFGSTAMGTAIMTLGRTPERKGGGTPQRVPVRVRR